MQKLVRMDRGETDTLESVDFNSLERGSAEPRPPSIEAFRPLSDSIRQQVGKRSLPSVSDEIRRCMLTEAVRLTSGNITKTAQMLGLTRQAVQQMLATFELKDWASELREIAGR